MNQPGHELASLVLLAGLLIVASQGVRAGLERAGVPPLVGFLSLGVLARVVDGRWGFLGPAAATVVEFLEGIGLVALLFRVGLECNPRGLIRQLPQASWIWLCNVLLSGVPGYLAGRWLGFERLPSLFLGVAMTATSVGVALSAWSDAGAVDTPSGQLLVDVAELDDISGVALMALLFALVPSLHGGGPLELRELGGVAGWFLAKLVVFAAGCFAFARYVEPPLTRLFERLAPSPGPMHLVTGVGIVIAALAGLAGFSLAIGALFAGLVYGRDRERLEEDSFYRTLYEVFAPFFFIGIGLKVEPQALGTAWGLGSILLGVAVLGKLAGTTLPALASTGVAGALLIGVSMVPRAEIAMIVMQQGEKLGSWAVPPDLFAAMLLVSAVSCVAAPWALRLLLERRPP